MLVTKAFRYLILSTVLMVWAAPLMAYDEGLVADVKPEAPSRAEGGRIGAFILKPSVKMMETYDDNIYRTANNRKSDFITNIKPMLELQSDWGLHEIKAGVSADFAHYNDNTSENYNDYAAYLSGKLDVDYGTYFSGMLKHERRHEERGSPEDVDGDEPIEFDINSAMLGFTRDLSKLKLYIDGTLRSYIYNDSSRSGTVIDNSIRDRDQIILRAKLAYEVTDDLQAFTQVSHDTRRYDESSVSYRDSDGYEFRLGASMNVTGKVEATAYAGYMTQDYDADTGDISTPSFGGSLQWNISELTSLKAEAERTVQETVLSGSSGIVRSALGLSLQHALTEDVLVDAGLDIRDDRYEGDSAGRDNTTYDVGLGLDYYMGYGFTARAAYNHLERDYDESDSSYDDNRVMVSVKYEY